MASIIDEFSYDVFLSFRGEDTRYGFTGNLKKALDDKGVCTFMDDEELQKGDEITPSLLKAIEDSKIAIVVLSKNYASSSFCLEELSKIIDSMKDKADRSILPVFYKVDPSDVRKLKKSYEEAMDKHEASSSSHNMNNRWKASLQQVANLSGFHYKKGEMYEHEFIGKIVEEVFKKITVGITLHVGDYLVGLEPQKQRVISLLNAGSDDTVHMVGIHGIGGIGKTTLALEVYNSTIHQFQCSCFLKVRENYHKNGLELQKILLSQIVKKNIDINSVEEGISILRKMLSKKKVLLILDDVDSEKQLQDIAGNYNWFGKGSRVIITTRNQRLLTLHGVEAEHTYEEASKIGIIYVNEWIKVEQDGKAFNKMKNLKTLLIDDPGHFDGTLKHLPNSLRVLDCRATFLPLAVFHNKKFQNMRVLNFDHPMLNLLQLHDLSNFPNLEELSIQNYWGKFTSDKSIGFLRNLKILRIISCSVIKSVPPLDCPSLIELDLSNCSSLESFPLTVNGFVGNLKILRLKKCRKIRIIPLNMLHSLEELNLNGCNSLESFSHVVGLGEKLKTMSIRSCYKLRSIPTLKLTSLEELDLSNCTSLQNFPSVVNGFLGKLKILRVDNCHNLKSIPPLKLDVLEELDLSNCHMVKRFLLSVGEFLGKVKTMRLAHCHHIKSIPLLKLDSLEKLDLSNCTSLESFSHVVGLGEKLKTMSVRSCFKLRSIPPLKLTSLEELDLSYCTSLESFPLVADEFLGKLKILLVANCHNLKSIPPLKLDSLEKLDLSNCYRLESFPPVVDGFLPKLKTLRVTSCHNLRSIPPLKLNSLEELDLSFCYSLESFPSVVDGLLDKLKFLNIEHCIMLKSMPPLRLTLLEKFNLSYCLSLESFPEILGEITNIPRILLYETPIKQLPFPFQHLTPPPISYPCRCGIVHLPNRVAAMSMLAEFTIKGEGKVSPMQSSHVEYICLRNCKLSDEYLSTSLMLFAKVKELHLTNNQFTVLPKSIEKCHFLWRLVLDDCEELQEIKGIPPCLRMLSALNCQSLTSSSKSKLLNQELHEVGNTWFRLPRAKIPEWFDHQCSEGLSISFWFRNKFPDILLCVGSPLTWFPNLQHRVRVIINDNTFFCTHGLNIGSSRKKMYHLHLFHMKMEKFNDNMDKALLENKWNHAEVDFGFAFQKSGIHVLKGKSNMKDIRFNDPENDANIVLHPGC